jgi:hypothetical protein
LVLVMCSSSALSNFLNLTPSGFRSPSLHLRLAEG